MITNMINEEQLKNVINAVNKCEEEIGKAIIGQKDIVRQVFIAILAGGNVLLEGVPGLGKTELVKTFGKVLDLSFSRIQFTPDLMPADVIGTNLVLRDSTGGSNFKFETGPIFSNLVLADEINRATPKTQSALLEAMQEKTVTVGKKTYPLPMPFMVLATQNPIEMEGTYPLPEAQLDRFLFKLDVKFPSLNELKSIMDITVTNNVVEINKIIDGEEIMNMRSIFKEVPMADSVKEYALKILLATHPESDESPEITKKFIGCGASPRAGQAIYTAARIRAIMEGRFNVSFDDVKYVAFPALRHRILLNFEGIAEGIKKDELIEDIIQSVKVI